MKFGSLLLLLIILIFSKSSFGQGRVVINEFMPWSGCATTSEFIELLNFGPGPMNIGCYTVTNGSYAVTIPPNTIIQPGAYFVLSGQNSLSKGCGNTDSLIHVDLNWASCNCTSAPRPTTGDGFMKDGGSANEKIVLLDPSLSVIDAVSRNNPVGSSVPITTSPVSGGCVSRTFDLSTMAISYETIGNSTGIDNSFARKVDGDCGWVKTTAISAHAPNKTGSSSSATYNFSTVNASQCQSTTGRVSIQVSAADVSSLFPMNYTLAFDVDSTGTFTTSDSYQYGADSSAPSIDINNLAYGRYRITVGSSSSCNLKNFDFFIFNCYGMLLPVKLSYFKYEGIINNQRIFKFKVEEGFNLKEVVLEGSNGTLFEPVTTLHSPFAASEIAIRTPLSPHTSYRLRLKDPFDRVAYSQQINVPPLPAGIVRHWPNPAIDRIFMEVSGAENTIVNCRILNSAGAVVLKSDLKLTTGSQTMSLPVSQLQSGIYYLQLTGEGLKQRAGFAFIKQ